MLLHRLRRAVSLGLLTAFVSLSLTGCYFLPQEETALAPPLKEPEQVTYRTEAARRHDLERWIKGTGYVVSTDTHSLMYKITSGRLKDVYVRSGDTVEKDQLIAELETGDLSYQLRELDIALRIAKANRSAALEQGGHALTIASLNLELAQLKYNRVAEQLERAKLYAPISGVVVYTTDAEQGAYVDAYTVIARISDPESLEISFTQEDVKLLKMGMEVDLALSSNETVKYKGTIVKTPDNLPADATDAEKKSIRISMENLPEKVKLGDTVYLSLLLERREDVIVVPLSYINRFSSRRYVRVLVDGIPEERDVELGLQTGAEAEVTSGIAEGDLLII